ncbi:hypothetical protein SLEP1_g50108 [Rubroshorea leprosula]|uniref:Bifunctional inhibitor/plant lipid transfer protein/seed storage helical domain-containing protein n=1 Tax=Rubroshorea leprosula TaxID=152421 RepID=A0AAV5LZ23_9ROSI|nr:hypothetical protein SLEP1_g50108 [Rubroshorea leprosula]
MPELCVRGLSTRSSSCCLQLASIIKSQPTCLCSLLNGEASSLGVTIDQTQALALPAACNVQAPPISECNASASPRGSPQGMPGDQTPNISSVIGSKIAPSTGGSSVRVNVNSYFQLVLIFLCCNLWKILMMPMCLYCCHIRSYNVDELACWSSIM